MNVRQLHTRRIGDPGINAREFLILKGRFNMEFFDIDNNDVLSTIRLKKAKQLLTVEEWECITNMGISSDFGTIKRGVTLISKLMSHGIFGDTDLLDELLNDEIIEYVSRTYNVENVVVNRFEYNGRFAKHDRFWKSEIPDKMSGFICSTMGFVLIHIRGFDSIVYHTNYTPTIVVDLVERGMKQEAIATVLNIAQSSVSNYLKNIKDDMEEDTRALMPGNS